MDKAAIPQIDADMTGFEAGFEKNQIARLEILAGFCPAHPGLFLSGTGQMATKPVLEGELHKRRAVDAMARITAFPIRHATPLLVLCIKALLYVSPRWTDRVNTLHRRVRRFARGG